MKWVAVGEIVGITVALIRRTHARSKPSLLRPLLELGSCSTIHGSFALYGRKQLFCNVIKTALLYFKQLKYVEKNDGLAVVRRLAWRQRMRLAGPVSTSTASVLIPAFGTDTQLGVLVANATLSSCRHDS